MKKKLLSISVLLLLILVITGCKKDEKDNQSKSTMNKDNPTTASSEDSNVETTIAPTTSEAGITEAAKDDTASIHYKDGVYEAETPLDQEKYFTKAKVTIKDGKVSAVDWTIYDSARNNKPFDEEYYKVMEEFGTVYAKQSKDDWKGSRDYSDKLIISQDVDKIDAVSGATWTCNKFKEAVKMALEKAKN